MPEENLIPRIPPHSEEAEQSVLGAIILEPTTIQVAAEHLKPDDFYNPRHKLIFEAMLSLYGANDNITLVTLKNQLERCGQLETVGSMKYIAEIAGAVGTSVYIRDHINIVKDKALYRSFIQMANNVLSKSYSTETPIEKLSDEVEKQVFGILQNSGSGDFTHIRDVILEPFNDIEEIIKNGGQIPGISTGFIDLDRITAGLHNSNLIIIGARPSMGKSALGLNIVQNAAVKSKKICAVFTLEMAKKEVANRMLACEAGVDLSKMRTGDIQQTDWEKLAEAMGVLAEANIYIDDTSSITLAEIRSRCRKLKIEHGLDMVMIDYLQLMEGGGNEASRQQEISNISRGLKVMAKELEVPVIALSQLSRTLETRADKRPMMSDLRESGAIEQDADVIMFIYRDEYYNPESEDRGVAEIIIGKQRSGSTGTVKLRYDGQYTRFSNLVH